MPEYFDVSFICNKPKKSSNQSTTSCIANIFDLQEGENFIKSTQYPFLAYKKVILNTYQNQAADFEEISISIFSVIFHNNTFEQELQHVTRVVKVCFEICKNIKLAVGSYEINSYYISQIHSINDFTQKFLLHFPLVYVREKNNAIIVTTNLQAQDIFTRNIFD